MVRCDGSHSGRLTGEPLGEQQLNPTTTSVPASPPL
jgi:hypothetical protein